MIYLDNAASTKAAPEVTSAIKRFLDTDYANPSGSSTFAAISRNAVEEAREKVAKLIGADRDEIIFTSGGTESNNTAIYGIIGNIPGGVLYASAIEHPSVLNTAKDCEKKGHILRILPAGAGITDPSGIEGKNSSTGNPTGLVSVMLVNNELGTIQPVQKLSEKAHECGMLFHTDAVAAAGHINIDVKELGADLLSISAHKFHGPKGIGALYVRRGVKILNLMQGGGQEKGLRSGTINVPGIVGMGIAAEIALKNGEENARHIRKLRKLFLERLSADGCEYVINGYDNDESLIVPSTINLGFKGIEGSSLLIELDMKGIVCSTGSACSASKNGPSHVLTAAGIDPGLIKGSLRISLSEYNTEEEMITAADILSQSVGKLKKLSCV